MPGLVVTSINEVLAYWWVGLVAFAVSLVATPIARYIAYRLKVVDRPDDLLKPHGRPIAYMGGVAMYAGLLIGLLVYLATMPRLQENWSELVNELRGFEIHAVIKNPIWSLIFIILSCGMMTMMGLIDDIRNLKPRQKLYWQTAAALILVVGGVGDRIAMVFLSLIGSSWPTWVVLPISVVMCILFVIATCNATNLLDGLDGLCGGVTGIIALGFLGLAVWLGMTVGYRPGIEALADYSSLRIALCLAMAGAILGFLPYNIPPASIFMGDAGSMLLGFFVATMMALFCTEGSVRWLMAAVVVYALPISDTALAVVRRLLAHKSIFAGDRSHLYDQLVDRGMSVKQVVALFYLLAVLAAVVGVCLSILVRARYAIIIDIVLAAIVWIIFWRKGMVRPPPHDTNKKIHD
jgi:UDP-GlcNAc:undecaprenyl-phosphate/decaprenyl-phosphate GlcNAc-1-phosphate transferase